MGANSVNSYGRPKHSHLKGNKGEIKPCLLTVLTGYGRPEHSHLR